MKRMRQRKEEVLHGLDESTNARNTSYILRSEIP